VEVITEQQAVDRLTEAAKTAKADDLVENYNEFFPANPIGLDEAKRKSRILLKKIIVHIDAGLEGEEILDLWHVVFPSHRRVSFDEDEGVLRHAERGEPAGHVD
jgi:hypothetical protein